MKKKSTFLILVLLLSGVINLCAQTLSEDAVQFSAAEGYTNDSLKNQNPQVGGWSGSDFIVNPDDPGTVSISDDAAWQIATYNKAFAATTTFTVAMKFSFDRADEALDADKEFIGMMLKSGSDKFEIKLQRMKWDNKRYRFRSFATGSSYFGFNTAITEDLFGFGAEDATSDNLWFEVVITKGDNANSWSAIAKVINITTEAEVMNWDLGTFAVAEAFHNSDDYYAAITSVDGGVAGRVTNRTIEIFDANPLVKTTTGISDIPRTLKIYPNPVKDVLNINSSDFNKIEIFNLLGRLVNKAEISRSTVDVSELETGIYIVKLIGSEVVVAKIAKE
jgi:hypothetical protein